MCQNQASTSPAKSESAGNQTTICSDKAKQASLKYFDELPDSAFVRQPVVLGLLCCSKSTLWRWVKSSLIPSPKKIGSRVSAWNVGELRSALLRLVSTGQANTIK